MHSKYPGRAVFLLAFLPLMLSGQRTQENVVPLKSWSTPLFWQPSQVEREATAKDLPQLRFSANAVSTNALTFVAITPCRLVDTRGVAAGFNGINPFSGPSIPGGGTITIPVQSSAEATTNTAPAPCGVIPSIAQAYSVNVTVVPAGGGPVNYVSLWPYGSPQPVVSTLNDPQGAIVANAAIVPAGANVFSGGIRGGEFLGGGGISVFNSGPAVTDVIIDMNGYFAAPTDVSGNTAVGFDALNNNTTGSSNTASGSGALSSNTTGYWNTASGAGALQSNTTGIQNTASGYDALVFNTTGQFNTASGDEALYSNSTGSNNTAEGSEALGNNSTGSNNTAIGASALYRNSGNYNIGIGYNGGFNVAAGSNNIEIGAQGSANDTSTIRIGIPGTQTSFFVAGVAGVTTGSNNAVPVMIDSNGQLGTVSSSRRFKEDIEDMGEASSGLLRLRPVTFRYRKPFADGSKPIEYGLIAEEVAQVYPDLVAHSADGQIETVKYQVLDSMLLNEVQKEHQKVQRQTEEIRLLQTRIAALEQLLTSKVPIADSAQ
jgi:hypothetical protein